MCPAQTRSTAHRSLVFHAIDFFGGSLSDDERGQMLLTGPFPLLSTEP